MRQTGHPVADDPGHPPYGGVTASDIEQWLLSAIADLTGDPPGTCSADTEFTDVGMSSMDAVVLTGQLQDYLGEELSPTLAWDYPNPRALARHLAGTGEETAAADSRPPSADDNGPVVPIAVVGMACRFPGAPSADAFWSLLDLEQDGLAAQHGRDGNRPHGLLPAIDQFDASFFAISEAEAAHVDPQQRLLLEASWQALEDAAITPTTLAGSRTGVFVGISGSDYGHLQLADPTLRSRFGGTGQAVSIAANRLSYLLDLRGPSLTIDTACSSSLVAVHLAMRSLRCGESDLALAGGVNVLLEPEITEIFAAAGTMAANGRCKTFDSAADGYVRSEGCGLVVLKRLTDALADGDRVLGVVVGSAIGQEGRTNGLSAPSGAGQQTVLRAALRDARMEPSDVGYVEAHGTGTSLGDPIEVAALSTVFGTGRDDANPLLIGSVKSNIGHAEAAAGIAGLIKVLLMLRHRRVPGQIHLRQLNPQLPASVAASIPRTSCEWVGEPGRLLTAGVSSFGFGGTISHVIVQELPSAVEPAPGPVEPAHPRPCHLLALSAASETAVVALAGRYETWLRDHPGADLGAMARTTTLGRGQLRHRAAVVATSHADAVTGLESLAGGTPKAEPPAAAYRGQTAPPGRLAMLFSGGGSQYINMGRELYVTNALFRDHLRHCQELLGDRLDVPLLSVLFPLPAHRGLLDRSRYLQPALVAVGYALAQVWRSWGVAADLVLGHSTGEFTAACVAGALDLGDALGLVAERGRLIEELCEPGSMAVVFAAEDVVRDAATTMPDDRAPAVAAVNAPGSVVVAGRAEDLAGFLAKLSERGVASRPLKVGHAFHSPMMQPASEAFARAARGLAVQDAAAGIVSDLDGRLFGEGYRPDADYWVRQLTEPVRFADGIRMLAEQGCSQFLEVGPGRALVAAGQQVLPGADWIPSMRPRLGNWNVLTEAVARLYTAGRDINWREFHRGEGQSRLAIPGYPFERQRHWLPIGGKPVTGAQPTVMQPAGTQSATAIQPTAVQPAGGAPMLNGRTPRPGTPAAVLTAGEAEPGAEAVLATLSKLLARQLGRQAAADPHRPFLELGADSLTLFQLLQAVQGTFQVTIPVVSLFEEMNTLAKLATHIRTTAPPSVVAVLPVPPRPPATVDGDRAPGGAPSASSSPFPAIPEGGPAPAGLPGLLPTPAGEPGIDQFLQVHAQVMSQAYELLRAGPAAENASVSGVSREGGADRVALAAGDTFIAFRPDAPTGAAALNGAQGAFAQQLIQRYTARTRRSKELAGAERRWHSDVRHAPQPFSDLNQIRYPVVVQRSLGSHVWDVDGNEYIDLTMGFGVNLFGHQEPFIVSALTSQLAEGIQLGPHTPLAAEVAQLICDLTGQQRVVFCNTGSEAVMVAIRLARAVTGRQRIALFAGSYHGSADPVLARQNVEMGSGESVPMAPGITEDVSRNVLVLPYGADDSLDVLRAHQDELAAVLVEPVQSRRPDLQPVEFLRQLRELTLAGGVPLIFDEMITGFRSHPGGVRGLFGIDADITAYGKILGGGLPIGVVAGDATYLDAIDGGAWQFDDAHHIPSVRTFFTGTFAKHPLALAAARAVLTELKSRGPGLQEELGARTADLIRRLNVALQTAGAAVQVARFGSMFRFGFPGEPPWSRNTELFYTALLDRGLYLWEGRTCFLSTAHTDADLDKIVSAVTHTAAEMAAAGALLAPHPPPLPPTPARDGAPPPGTPALEAPVTADAGPDAPAREAAVPAEAWPLSRAQQEIWLLAQLGSDQSRAYNEGVLLDMRGELDHAVLRWAVTEVLARHDSLHAVIDADGTRQRRVPAATDLPLVDFAAMTAQEQPKRVTAWFEAQAGEEFDFTARPPVHAAVLRLTADHHQLYVGVHHVMVDGWSFGVMAMEIAELYDARLAGRNPALPEPVQYAEHVAWEQRRESDPAWQAAMRYWQEQYADGVPDLVLPADYPKPRAAGHRLGTLTREIASDIAVSLPGASSELSVTQFGLLVAAYAYLLHQLSRQDDLVIAVPFARRSYPGGERVVGNCSTVLPVRSRLSAGARVRDYVRTMHQTLISGHEHSDFSIAALRQHTSVGNGAGGRIFAAAFNQDRASAPAHSGGLRVSVAAPPGRFTKADLIFDVMLGGGGVRLTVAYDAELFRPATVDRYADMFEHLLRQFIADPDAPLDRVRLVSPEVLDPAPWHGGGTAATAVDPPTLPALVERQAERSPGATAVCQRDASLSYAELNARANRLARHLVELGAGPERTVTLAGPPDISLIVGVLAVLKAGAAYHLLDIGQPPARLACVRPDLVLTTRAAGGPPEMPTATLVVLDDPATGARISAANDTDLTDADRREPLLPDHPALVLCPPGSGGQPCGITIPHAAVMNMLRWCQHELPLTQEDRVLSSTSAGFEPLICWPLGAGGAIVMAGPDGERDPGRIAELIRQTGTTTALLRPAVLGDFLDRPEAGSCRSLRYALCDCGPLPRGLAERCHETLDADLMVLYQPAGAPTCPTARHSRPGQPDDGTSIGRPIWNTSVYLLDRCLRPVPPGVVGELYMAGAGLPRGYHRRGALTAEYFLPVPFGAPGERMYRTGALARWSDDGVLLLAGQEKAQAEAAVTQMGAGEIEVALRILPV